MKKLLIATVALLLFAAPALAGSYAKGTVGYFSPTENDLDGSYLVHAAVGSDFGGPVSAELGVGYTAPDADGADVTIIPITLTALYELPLNLTDVAFNVGAGVGMYMWDIDIDGGGSEDGNDFGYHVQAGAEFKLNEQVSLIGEVKWAKVDLEIDDGDEVDGGGASFNVGGKFNF